MAQKGTATGLQLHVNCKSLYRVLSPVTKEDEVQRTGRTQTSLLHCSGKEVKA